MSPLRIAIYNSKRELQGYWFLTPNKTKEGEIVLTCRDPLYGSFHCTRTKDASQAVLKLCQTYIKYQDRTVGKVAKEIAELPTKETNKPGFRPGWLNKQRHQLISLRAELMFKAKREYSNVLELLKNKGWPLPELLPRLSWEQTDVTRITAAPWLRGSDPRQVPEGTVKNSNLQRIGDSPKQSDRTTEEVRSVDDQEVGLQVNWQRASQLQAIPGKACGTIYRPS